MDKKDFFSSVDLQQKLLKEESFQLEDCTSKETGRWYVEINKEKKILPLSSVLFTTSCLHIIGFKSSDNIEKNLKFWLSRIHSDDINILKKIVQEYIRKQNPSPIQLEFRLQHKNLSWRWIELYGTVVSLSKKNSCFGGIIRDITEEYKLKEKIKGQLLFQQGLLEVLPHPVFIKDGSARFISFNSAYEKAFGINREDLIGKNVMDLDYLPLEDRIQYQKEDMAMIATGAITHREIDFLLADGKIHHCLYWSCGLLDSERKNHGLIGLIVDITEQKKTEQELVDKIKEINEIKAKIETISKIDDLTQIANRRCFMETLKRNISIAERHKSPLCLLMADLDFFKLINDKHGHTIGDKVLVHFAKILKESCRKEDFPARSGGEEFFVITPMTNLSGAKAWAKRMQDKVRKTKVNGITFTISIGVVEYIENEGIHSFLKRADEMMYKAKDLGRDIICIQDKKTEEVD